MSKNYLEDLTEINVGQKRKLPSTNKYNTKQEKILLKDKSHKSHKKHKSHRKHDSFKVPNEQKISTLQFNKENNIVNPRQSVTQINEKLFREELQYIKEHNPCSDKELHMLDKLTYDLNTENLQTMLSSEFYNLHVLHNFQCLLEQTFYTSPHGNVFTPEERERIHIKNVLLISDKTAYSKAYIAKYNNKISIVIKEALKQHGNIALAHEGFVGLYAINNLREFIPNFMYTYGLVNENKFINYKQDDHKFNIAYSYMNINDNKAKNYNDNKLHLVVEAIDNATALGDMFTTIDYETFLPLFMQILYALETAQYKYRFTHYDLHSYNVLINDRKKDDTMSYILYNRPNGKLKYVPASKIATIIDFGFTHVTLNGEDHGLTHGAASNVVNSFNSLFDIYKLLGFLTINYFEHKKKNTNLNFFKENFFSKVWNILGIENWYNYFGQERNKDIDYTIIAGKNNPEDLSNIIDSIEIILDINNSYDLESNNIFRCTGDNCLTSETIDNNEFGNVIDFNFKDIISMYDYYTYTLRENNHDDNRIAINNMNNFIKYANYFTKFKTEFDNFWDIYELFKNFETLDQTYKTIEKINIDILLDDSTDQIIINTKKEVLKALDVHIYNLLEKLHNLNNINFYIRILKSYLDYIANSDHIFNNEIRKQNAYYKDIFDQTLNHINYLKEILKGKFLNNTKITNLIFVLEKIKRDKTIYFHNVENRKNKNYKSEYNFLIDNLELIRRFSQL